MQEAAGFGAWAGQAAIEEVPDAHLISRVMDFVSYNRSVFWSLCDWKLPDRRLSFCCCLLSSVYMAFTYTGPLKNNSVTDENYIYYIKP